MNVLIAGSTCLRCIHGEHEAFELRNDDQLTTFLKDRQLFSNILQHGRTTTANMYLYMPKHGELK